MNSDRDTAVAPVSDTEEYLKYGFVRTRHQVFRCPACNSALNAGPNYQPKYCDQCGQHLDFSDVAYDADEFLGYVDYRQY